MKAELLVDWPARVGAVQGDHANTAPARFGQAALDQFMRQTAPAGTPARRRHSADSRAGCSQDGTDAAANRRSSRPAEPATRPSSSTIQPRVPSFGDPLPTQGSKARLMASRTEGFGLGIEANMARRCAVMSAASATEAVRVVNMSISIGDGPAISSRMRLCQRASARIADAAAQGCAKADGCGCTALSSTRAHSARKVACRPAARRVAAQARHAAGRRRSRAAQIRWRCCARWRREAANWAWCFMPLICITACAARRLTAIWNFAASWRQSWACRFTRRAWTPPLRPKHGPSKIGQGSARPLKRQRAACATAGSQTHVQNLARVVDAVATAHTLDDQAETVLAKFLRGAWTEGLAGISPKLEIPEGPVVAPAAGRDARRD